MKNKVPIMLVLLMLVLSAAGQDQMEINGKINRSSETTVYLFKWSNVKPVKIDSTVAKEGMFHLKKLTQLPGVFFLTAEPSRVPITLFPEKDALSVDIQFSTDGKSMVSYTVTGNTEQLAYNNYKQVRKALSVEYAALSDAYNKAKEKSDDQEMRRIDIQIKNKEKQLRDLDVKMIEDNTSNLLSLFFLVNNRDKFDYAGLKNKMDKIPSGLQNNDLFSFLQKHLLKVKQ